MSDPAKYRTKEEENDHKKNRDPLLITKSRLMEDFGVSQDVIEELEQCRCRKLKMPMILQRIFLPDTNQIYDFVYVD